MSEDKNATVEFGNDDVEVEDRSTEINPQEKKQSCRCYQSNHHGRHQARHESARAAF